ncbi:SulP family inorganic anion transporter [Thiothrix nivea]|uniref:Sulfate transporter n=1 Tax=Thiothrix nivea (strain ATCC 35100 / DSM 5205 / JP2) TaxID=870187 RepID=A0A656HLA9_THINJ|nr:SulP family inorganic anion transporter [Thiothrix nivea]EIJ36904.1 sulfate transporter [Thiothrix nivea DSM 5205]
MFDLIRKNSPHQIKNDVLSGLTVALALVPEAVAFALIAHVHPLVGLYAAFMMGLITAVFGGRPGMISGATGATAVVMVSLVLEHGVEYLFAAVVLTGLIQIAFGVLKLGKFIRLVPHPVFLGFVNGLALVIFLAQLDHFKVKDATGEVIGWVAGAELGIMLGLIALTMAIIQFLPRLTTIIPSTLAAILAGTLLTIGLGLDTRTVGDMASIAGGLPSFHLPEIPFGLEAFKVVLPYAVVLAMVGLIESLLTLNLVDELTETTGQPNRECIGQGVANTVNGFFGGMGGCAMVGQSMINIKSGGRGRLSGISAALFLLAFILVAAPLIEQIPIAVLVGVMFMVVIGTFEWGSLRLFGKVPPADILIVIVVMVVTVLTDLAIAVVSGVILAALVFAWEHARHIYAQQTTTDDGWKIYDLNGPLFFASAQNFQDIFTPNEDPNDVIVDFRHSRVADHSALAAIDKLAERYEKVGKTLHLRHLTPECRLLLKKAGKLVEVDVFEDPKYHVAVDKLKEKLGEA